MKVMAVAPSLVRAGAERVVSLLSLEWSKSCEVVVVLFDGSEAAYEWGGRLIDLKLAGRTRMGSRARVVFSGVGRLASLYRLEQPDRILSFMEPANFPSAIGAAVAGMSERLTVSVHHDPTKTALVSPGADPVDLPPSVPRGSGFRGREVGLGVHGGPGWKAVPRFTILWLGVATWNRMAHRFRGATSWARGGYGARRDSTGCCMRSHELTVADVHLVILGEGSERGKLIELSHELGLGERVHLPGVVSDIETWYRHAECFVLSSRSEAWAMVLVEAMAHGCPVVSFRCDYGPAEIIDHGRNGILVTEGDVGALATAVARVIEDGSLRRRLVTEGRERAAEFDVAEIAPRWIGD